VRSVSEDGKASRVTRRRFFCAEILRERLDRARVQRNPKLLLNLLAQLQRQGCPLVDEALADEGQDLSGQFSWPLGPRLLRQQTTARTLAYELVLQVVERLAADPVPAADRAYGIAVDQMGTRQLVADLGVILGVEELRPLLE